ncbi:hypothetical protein [Polaromonas sp.]|jgi:hypothetical protein|uniref:hypothetical protein n=1 Tax=Polaromonas sp. TaxID=1869339 RepID=UPI001A2B6E9F|nr:hypothetical protein [Burkholderiales bacterium]
MKASEKGKKPFQLMLSAMKLPDYFRSCAAFCVRIALEPEGLVCEPIPGQLARGGHKLQKAQLSACPGSLA